MTCPKRTDKDHQGTAALHALGALDPPEALAYERHLAGCPACREQAEALAGTVSELEVLAPSVPPAPGLRARLLERIAADAAAVPAANPVQTWKTWRPGALERERCLRADEGAWESTGCPGVEVRRLFVDPARDRVTMLVRMAPGSAYPSHRHGGDEECYVLSGDLHVGPDLVMHAGDFQHAPRGSLHEVQSTENGCLLFLTSSLCDELLPGAAAGR